MRLGFWLNEGEVVLLEQLADLFSEGYRESVRAAWEVSKSQIQSRILEVLSDRNTTTLVAMKDDTPVGCICWHQVTNSFEARSRYFFVLPRFRGSWLPVRLVREMESRCRRANVNRIVVGMSGGTSVERTSRFFERLGYSKIGSVVMSPAQPLGDSGDTLTTSRFDPWFRLDRGGIRKVTGHGWAQLERLHPECGDMLLVACVTFEGYCLELCVVFGKFAVSNRPVARLRFAGLRAVGGQMDLRNVRDVMLSIMNRVALVYSTQEWLSITDSWPVNMDWTVLLDSNSSVVLGHNVARILVR